MRRTHNRGSSLVMGSLATIAIGGVLVTVACAGLGTRGLLGVVIPGWFAPLVALSIIGGLALMLLGANKSERDNQPRQPSVECPECGRSVMGQWRMCPYCGQALEPVCAPRLTTPE